MARHWESIINYEDRTLYKTSRWRLLGISTLEGSENTDSGVLWLEMSKAGNTATANLYKDDGLESANKVATGTADVSSTDGTGANAAEVSLSESNSSGISGTFWIHEYTADGSSPLQVALCTDEDLDSLWDGIEDLTGYDATNGMAEFIRVAGDDVIGQVSKLFSDELGGHGSTEAWFITDASRTYPDLRRIANPSQLRLACACRALEVAIGRNHHRAEDTAYSVLRDKFGSEYAKAMSSLTLAVKTGGGDDATNDGSVAALRLSRA